MSYTYDQAVADLELVLSMETDNYCRDTDISISGLADAFSLVERHEGTVQAVLMSQGNFDRLLACESDSIRTGPLPEGAVGGLWSAAIFCPLMPDDVVFCLYRFRDRLGDAYPGPSLWSRLTLDGVERVIHSAYRVDGKQILVGYSPSSEETTEKGFRDEE